MSTRRGLPTGIQVLCALGMLDAGLSTLRALGAIGLAVIFGSPIGGLGGVVSLVLAVVQLLVVWGLWEMWP